VRRQTPLVTEQPPGGRGFAARAGGQLVLREVNEQIAGLTGEWNETGVSLFVCECSAQGCAEALEISATEYERIRADEANFAVFPGHEQPELGRVVDRRDRFVVVATREPVGNSAHAAESSQR